MAETNLPHARVRKARSDGFVGALERTIERCFGLPKGSVRIIAPNGRNIRSDARVGTLRRVWDA